MQQLYKCVIPLYSQEINDYSYQIFKIVDMIRNLLQWGKDGNNGILARLANGTTFFSLCIFAYQIKTTIEPMCLFDLSANQNQSPMHSGLITAQDRRFVFE